MTGPHSISAFKLESICTYPLFPEGAKVRGVAFAPTGRFPIQYEAVGQTLGFCGLPSAGQTTQTDRPPHLVFLTFSGIDCLCDQNKARRDSPWHARNADSEN